MSQVLIVEDDKSLAMALRDGFQYEGYAVLVGSDGVEGMRLALENGLDLIILDVMLPRKSGFEVCAHLRQAGCRVPIIFLSVRCEEHDKVLGLKLGADDYVVKPFSFFELMARAEAVLRRTSTVGKKVDDYDFGDLHINFNKHQALKRGAFIELSVREFDILKFLIQKCGQVVTRDQLLNSVWGYDRFPFTRTVDVHIAKLRRKIEDDASRPRHLLTIHGNGYKFVP